MESKRSDDNVLHPENSGAFTSTGEPVSPVHLPPSTLTPVQENMLRFNRLFPLPPQQQNPTQRRARSEPKKRPNDSDSITDSQDFSRSTEIPPPLKKTTLSSHSSLSINPTSTKKQNYSAPKKPASANPSPNSATPDTVTEFLDTYSSPLPPSVVADQKQIPPDVLDNCKNILSLGIYVEFIAFLPTIEEAKILDAAAASGKNVPPGVILDYAGSMPLVPKKLLGIIETMQLPLYSPRHFAHYNRNQTTPITHKTIFAVTSSNTAKLKTTTVNAIVYAPVCFEHYEFSSKVQQITAPFSPPDDDHRMTGNILYEKMNAYLKPAIGVKLIVIYLGNSENPFIKDDLRLEQSKIFRQAWREEFAPFLPQDHRVKIIDIEMLTADITQPLEQQYPALFPKTDPLEFAEFFKKFFKDLHEKYKNAKINLKAIWGKNEVILNKALQADAERYILSQSEKKGSPITTAKPLRKLTSPQGSPKASASNPVVTAERLLEAAVNVGVAITRQQTSESEKGQQFDVLTALVRGIIIDNNNTISITNSGTYISSLTPVPEDSRPVELKSSSNLLSSRRFSQIENDPQGSPSSLKGSPKERASSSSSFAKGRISPLTIFPSAAADPRRKTKNSIINPSTTVTPMTPPTPSRGIQPLSPGASLSSSTSSAMQADNTQPPQFLSQSSLSSLVHPAIGSSTSPPLFSGPSSIFLRRAFSTPSSSTSLFSTGQATSPMRRSSSETVLSSNTMSLFNTAIASALSMRKSNSGTALPNIESDDKKESSKKNKHGKQK